jgi:hypothetical protein
LLHRLSKLQAEATTNAGTSTSHRAELPARPPGPPARFSADSGSFGPVAPRRDNWPRGVTASTLDSESSDRGSNPCGASPDRDQSGRQHFPPIIFGRQFTNGDVATSRELPDMWTHWDLNPRHSACEADVIPLHHVPHRKGKCRGGTGKAWQIAMASRL